MREYFLSTRRAGTNTRLPDGTLVRGEIRTDPILLRRYRKATARFRALPDFIIIGGAKCGTTALFNYVAEHPEIAPPFEKEPHYFAHNYHLGVDWYRSFFPIRSRTFEASTAYLRAPEAPKYVRALLPHIKLIALLRDPVERAFSHYLFTKRRYIEPLSFEEALKAEPKRTDSFHYSYAAQGRYLEQIKRWRIHFPERQMLVISSEDLRKTTLRTYDRCLDFLGLSPYMPEIMQYNVRPTKERMNPRTRRWLTEHFHPHNEALFDYLGEEFPWPLGRSCAPRLRLTRPFLIS